MLLVLPGYVDQNKSTLNFVVTDKHTEAIYISLTLNKEARKHLIGCHQAFSFHKEVNAVYNATTKKAGFYFHSYFRLWKDGKRFKPHSIS